MLWTKLLKFFQVRQCSLFLFFVIFCSIIWCVLFVNKLRDHRDMAVIHQYKDIDVPDQALQRHEWFPHKLVFGQKTTCQLDDVIRLLNDSNTGLPMSQFYFRSGDIYDNLCLLHYGVQNRKMLEKIGVKVPHLSPDTITSKCRRNTSNPELVPNIVFYVIYGTVKFTFIHYLSFLSAHKFVKPEYLYLVGDRVPTGDWWARVMKDIPYVKFVYWPRPQYIFGRKITRDIHASDVVRLQIFLIDGGIYFDTDLLILRSLEPLRHNVLTMGLVDNGTGVGNGFVLSKRGGQFLRLWYMSHRNFDPEHNYFGQHSMQVPLKLWHMFPHLVHVEQKTVYQPSWNDHNQWLLYEGQYDWSKNYAIHAWHNTKHHIPVNLSEIWTKNSTLGEIVRHIVYTPETL